MPHCKKSTCFRSSPRLKTDKTTIRNCNLRHKTWQPISKNTLTTKHLEKSQHDHPKQRKWEKRTLWKEIDLKLMKHKTSRVLPPSVKPIRHQICSSNNSTDSLKLPKYQEYANKQKRKNTFEHLQPHNDALSTAGFYYCGLKRLLKCFFCGISHDPFEFRSDDWKEICVLHAKRSSKCGFVLMQFGEIFLQEVEKKKKKVSDRMLYERLMSNLELNNDNNFLERDPAVLAVCELGYSRNAVQEIADLIIQVNQVSNYNTVWNQDFSYRQSKSMGVLLAMILLQLIGSFVNNKENFVEIKDALTLHDNHAETFDSSTFAAGGYVVQFYSFT
ncbi:hypothetical protein Btru_068731 [Bulinus truncatus]|nr:hypothetical protein Btru_068731 [Bulinus truncatus]